MGDKADNSGLAVSNMSPRPVPIRWADENPKALRNGP
jgi:hypothetical protein